MIILLKPEAYEIIKNPVKFFYSPIMFLSSPSDIISVHKRIRNTKEKNLKYKE